MKKSRLLTALVLFAALFAFKTFFPETAKGLIQNVHAVFKGDIDYTQAFCELGESIPAFGNRRDGEAEARDVETAIILRPVEITKSSVAPDIGETASNSGELASVSQAEEIPAAVTAFLEKQKEYADYALPENVSYEYTPYPKDYAIPVAGYSSSGFGYRLHPIKGEVRFHYGTDFAAWTGEDVLAFDGGTVCFAGYSDSYGNYVTVDHGKGWQSLYAHCSSLCVSSGDSVEAGERIALVGETGLATGPHLHFELTKDGVYVNPEYYVN